ncbi:MAG: serine/threonine-protein kinase [Sandaracinaceae bacterium]
MVTAVLPPDELDEEERSSIVPEVEQRFGRYRLCYELASGGMGKVFLARSEGARSFEKLVALKRIHPHLAEKKLFVDMFLDEARITSRIAHPNVCSVFDFGHEGGTYYLAMEYLFGEPLSHVIRGSLRYDKQDPRRIPHIARILADACEGLHAAHELEDGDGNPLGVVHRDVSPHNIFVTYDGGVKVVDFGIARAADQLHETTTGAVKGKWAYMAPEQARGNAMDRRVDVWALGVVLWEGATGRRLFRRKSQTETVLALVNDPIPRPSEVEPSVPSEIDEICMRALSRDADMRWPSARAMGRAIRHFLASRGSPVGLAEIAEWMEELFPGIRDRKQALVGALAERPSLPDPNESIETMEMLPSHLVERLDKMTAPSGRRTRKPSVSTVRDRPVRVRKRTPAPDLSPRDGPPVPEIAVASPPSVSVVSSPSAPPLQAVPEARSPWARRGIILVAVAAVGLAGGAASVPLFSESPPVSPPLPVSAAASVRAEDDSPELPPLGVDVPPSPAGEEARSREDVAEPVDPSPPAAPTEPAVETTPRTATRSTERRPERTRPERIRTEAPATEPIVEPSGEGTVNLVTVGGWALVFEDGRPLGETPVRLTLPAGRHMLEVRPFGRRPGRPVAVHVRAGGRERIAIPLDTEP